MFKRMKISEQFYEGVVEYSKKTWEYSKRAGLNRNKKQEYSLSIYNHENVCAGKRKTQNAERSSSESI